MSWRAHDTASSHRVASSDVPGLRLHLRAHGDDASRRPVLFVHGATYASRLYDIPHPGASWLKATAEAGLAAYALDVRGYGLSRAPATETARAPLATGRDALRDIGDAVGWIAARHGTRRIALVGGSWGSITTARYAATSGADRVSRLLLYAPIYAERNAGWLSLLGDPSDPTRPAAWGAARRVGAAETMARWRAEMPGGADWIAPAVAHALVASSLADDPEAGAVDPPAFRAPNGTFLDLWEAFNARPLYDPSAIRCPVMLIRGGCDPTSTRTDATTLFDRLGAQDRRYVEIANGTHFVSAERRAPAVFAAASAFLAAADPSG